MQPNTVQVLPHLTRCLQWHLPKPEFERIRPICAALLGTADAIGLSHMYTNLAIDGSLQRHTTWPPQPMLAPLLDTSVDHLLSTPAVTLLLYGTPVPNTANWSRTGYMKYAAAYSRVTADR